MEKSTPLLLIDDDETLCFLLKEILDSKGFLVSTHHTHETALDSLEKNSFPVILLDYNLPEKSGLEILTEIRKKNIDSEVIILTGHPSWDLISEFLPLGIYDFLVKPVNTEYLGHICNQALKKYNLAEENLLAQEGILQKNKELESSLLNYETNFLLQNSLNKLNLAIAKLKKVSSLEELISKIPKTILEIVPAQYCFFSLINKTGNLIIQSSNNIKIEKNSKPSVFSDLVLRQNKYFFSEHSESSANSEHISHPIIKEEVKNIFCLPLQAINQKTYGVIEIINKDNPFQKDIYLEVLLPFLSFLSPHLELLKLKT